MERFWSILSHFSLFSLLINFYFSYWSSNFSTLFWELFSQSNLNLSSDSNSKNLRKVSEKKWQKSNDVKRATAYLPILQVLKEPNHPQTLLQMLLQCLPQKEACLLHHDHHRKTCSANEGYLRLNEAPERHCMAQLWTSKGCLRCPETLARPGRALDRNEGSWELGRLMQWGSAKWCGSMR